MPRFVYEAMDYREILLAKIDSNKARRGYKTALAQAAGCHRSHLSQVLSRKSDLTEEQALGLATYWGYGDQETDRFLYMLKASRATSQRLRDYCEKRVAAITQESTPPTIGGPAATVLGPSEQAIFYSSWHYLATHVLLAIPGHGSAEAVAERLRIPVKTAHNAIRTLEKINLIRRKGKGWQLTSQSTFIARQAAMGRLTHLHWRLKAIEKIQQFDDDSLNFTTVLAVSRKDFASFKQRITALIEGMAETMASSAEEELVGFNCDLFRI